MINVDVLAALVAIALVAAVVADLVVAELVALDLDGSRGRPVAAGDDSD